MCTWQLAKLALALHEQDKSFACQQTVYMNHSNVNYTLWIPHIESVSNFCGLKSSPLITITEGSKKFMQQTGETNDASGLRLGCLSI